MASKLIPRDPASVMVVRDLTPNITILSVPFARAGLFDIGGRCTIVRLAGGGVLVYSPVALTPAAEAVVERLGGAHGVKYLVAPDLEHHIFLSDWAEKYPEARIIAPEGLFEKRAAVSGKAAAVAPGANVRPDQPFFGVVRNQAQAVLGDELVAEFALAYFPMHPNREIVLFYRPERVLIQADLFFNLPAVEQYTRVPRSEQHVNASGKPDLANRIFRYFTTTEGEPIGARRLLWYLMSRGDRTGFNARVQDVDQWPFHTVIPCHGEVIDRDGKEVFRKVFAWHLDAAKKQA